MNVLKVCGVSTKRAGLQANIRESGEHYHGCACECLLVFRMHRHRLITVNLRSAVNICQVDFDDVFKVYDDDPPTFPMHFLITCQ